ncbi:MAG: phosphotransferase [Ilumatobacter sp.]|uniref:phosphotransferase n=1 Tax=Ilumatobacter sp. TaxID=1967498 RepID=UPI00391CFF40
MADVTIPTQIADITVDWLNEVLGGPTAGFGMISSFEAARFGEGVGILGELARLHLTYGDGETGPATIVAKCQSPSPENQFLSQMMGFYLRETNFYRHVAGDVDIRVPRPHYVDAAPDGLPFVLLIEDIQGAVTPDQIAGLSVEEAKKIISTIVPLHVQFWGTDELLGLEWLPPMNNDLYKGGQAMATALFPGFAEHFGDRIPAAELAAIGRACERYAELLDYTVTIGTPTFTHTDCRAENYLFGGPDGDDAVTVIDFQLSTRHVGMWDVTNLLAGSMEPALRKETERSLLEHYVAEINAAGIDYTIEQAVHEYRVCLLQQTTAQVITSDLQGGNERGTALLEQLHLRPVHAAVDNDAMQVLDLF